MIQDSQKYHTSMWCNKCDWAVWMWQCDKHIWSKFCYTAGITEW